MAQTLRSAPLIRSSVISRDTHMHRRTETTDRTLVETDGTAFNPSGSMAFLASLVQNASELQGMYDSFIIRQVRIEFQWGLGASVDEDQRVPPRLNLLFDPDASSDTIDQQLRQSGRTRSIILSPQKRHVVYLKPCVRAEVYKSALTTGYMNQFDASLDVANFEIPHYGLVWQLQTVGAGLSGSLTARVTYDLEMRNTR